MVDILEVVTHSRYHQQRIPLGSNGEALHSKLTKLTDLVEVHMAEAAEGQRLEYNKHSKTAIL